ncbi:pyridoxamine 5'-phosphate oxidase family protein [Streptomyces zagrosensis]|uniref:Nitroimidazol reductase NimA-like FMN-containing flavoprotein (Pyridoxamine 5'-phosphate oxidase superfamily) n=1 Tax=Streptomyces zagrosensis TaxID=1042984 RepID=A0A7W9Q5T2_9ACTN|nr:pyridoxamine 5'-phosphate oxidase family protein [Streptomyces zagrosensis]MBB5933658.1 nitroimidazol reductase NimA-like FMN-containing flavoprotein (pyridoxamine 5'-phosphate oxidase superfamily) [Streptomyces zagrosensis]
MPLSIEERQSFLAEPHVAALAVTAEEGRAPVTVPVWYMYEPGGDVLVMTERGSRKAGLITAAGRFSLLVQRTSPTLRYVSVEGPVASIEPATEEEHRVLAARYLPADGVADYLTQAVANATDLVNFRLRTERWLSADLGLQG